MNMLQRLLTDVPLIEHGALTALTQGLDVSMAEHQFMRDMRERLKPKMTMAEGIATIPIEGPMAYAPDPFEMLYLGVEDSRNVQDMITAAANDPAVHGILLSINSPGGMVVGGFEIADTIRGAKKPTVAWAGGWMTSLAYLFGSQADKIVTTRTAQVGSVGTIISFNDYSKMFANAGVKVEVFTNKEGTLKGAGANGTSLTDEQRTHIQERVDKAHSEFKKQVLSKRPGIPDEAMRGQSLFGSEALKAGMVDAIGDVEFAKAHLRRMMSGRV